MTKEQKILLLLVILVGGAGAGFYVSNAKKVETSTISADTKGTGSQAAPAEASTTQTGNTASSPSANSAQPAATTAVAVPAQASPIKSYTQDVTYRTPENGSETIQVKLSIKDGAITDVAFSYDTPNKRESAYNLGNFEKALASQDLIGKKVNDVSLSRIGGASLTTKAFNEALTKIAAKV